MDDKVTFQRFFRLTARGLSLRCPRFFSLSRVLWLAWDYCFRPVRD